jgi:tetratricopeptide (TPR) repeat protein
MSTRTSAGMFMVIAALITLVSFEAYGQQAKQPQVQAQPAAQTESNYLQKGQAHYENGEYEEALAALKEARIREPRSAAAAFYLGMTYKKMEDFAEAARNLREAVTLQPPVKEAFVELADAYYAVGKNDEALHALEVSEREGVEPAQTAFLRGLVLLKKKKYDEATASFEKARALDGKLAASADFQIATVYERQGKEAEALGRFRALAAADPGSSIGEMAQQQVDILTSKRQPAKTFHATADVQYQYDSNVVLKPDSAVTATISGMHDSATVVVAHADYAPEMPAPFGLKFQYALYLSEYQKLKSFNVQSHTIGVSPTYRIGNNTAHLQLNGNYTLVDNSGYLASMSAAPMFSFVTGEDQYAQASLRYQKNDFLIDPPAADEDRSGSDVAAGISWFKLVAGQKGYINLKYEVNKETTKGANWSYLGNKLHAAALYPVINRVQAMAGLEAYRQHFDKPNTSFDNASRTDMTYTANIQALYALTKAVDLHLQYMYIKDQSSIDVYRYSKNIAGLGLYAKF